MNSRMIAVAATLLLCAAGVAQETDRPDRGRFGRGQGGPPGPGGPNFEMLSQRVADQLDLDDQQRASYDEIVAGFRERFAQGGQGEQMRDLMRQMREARQAGDDALAEDLRRKMEETRRTGDALREDFLSQVEPILRPDQVERLATIRERFGAMERQRFGNPMQQIAELRDVLHLDDQQNQQFDDLLAEMREQMRSQRGMGAELRPLIEELRAAQEAGDEERVAEIRARLAELRPDPREMFDNFYADLEKILRADQLQALRDFRARQPGPPGQDRAARTDVRSLFREARRLDLSRDQADDLADLEETAGRANRDARRERAAADQAQAALYERVKQQIIEILTPEQRQQFERTLQRAERGERGERARPRGGAEGERPPRGRPDRR
ncbi:MAG TPA: hypothetical protein PKC49_02025 [Phycisphaerae bacterium]|nr:hypothetical protein [Phycisphaerae bacterium]